MLLIISNPVKFFGKSVQVFAVWLGLAPELDGVECGRLKHENETQRNIEVGSVTWQSTRTGFSGESYDFA